MGYFHAMIHSVLTYKNTNVLSSVDSGGILGKGKTKGHASRGGPAVEDNTGLGVLVRGSCALSRDILGHCEAVSKRGEIKQKPRRHLRGASAKSNLEAPEKSIVDS